MQDNSCYHARHIQDKDHYNIRPDIKSKEPSAKHARTYNAGTDPCKDDANADSRKYDADTDSPIRTHAPIKDES